MSSATEISEIQVHSSASSEDGLHLPSFGPKVVNVSIVIPCFNEEDSIENLAAALNEFEQTYWEQYQLEFLFVDDGSTDGTVDRLNETFGEWSNVSVIRHRVNQGIAAAIQTGIRASENEIVCSIDSDCTYEPVQLGKLLALLEDDVAAVTASPYHPDGSVENVAHWRLALSRAASFLYRRIFRSKLHTYTSCFRAYRKSYLSQLELQEPGFVGITELLLRIDRSGGKIVECPAKLTTRVAGQSKLRVMKVATGHLRLMKSVVFGGS